jgi:molybdopterin converting factor small subunit
MSSAEGVAAEGKVTVVLHGYFSRQYNVSRRAIVLPLAQAATPRSALAALALPAGAVGLLLVAKQQVTLDTPLHGGDTLDVLPLLGGGSGSISGG